MEALVAIIVQLIGGGIGGNVLAQLAKNLSLGTAGNSIVGAVGGLITTWIASQIPGLAGLVGNVAATAAATPAVGGLDLGALAGQGIVGLIGGAILTAMAGLIKNATMK